MVTGYIIARILNNIQVHDDAGYIQKNALEVSTVTTHLENSGKVKNKIFTVAQNNAMPSWE